VTLLIEPLAILAVVMFARAVSETVLTPSPPGFTVATEVICVLGILVLLARPGLAASLVAAVIAILAGANLLVLVARRPRAERQRLAPTADGDPNG
jgi:O-antigen/teichoic acid export membrane protein